MPDFIKSNDNDYAKQLNIFTEYVKANAATVGVTPTEATGLDTARTAYTTSLGIFNTAATTANSLCQTKDTNRAAVETIHRGLNKRFQANPAITPAQKTAMQLNVPSDTRTRAAVPTTRPVATIGSGGHLRHIITYRDETTPGSKAKPAGVVGAEVWGGITAQGAPPPAAPDAYTMLAQDSSPHLVEQEAADTGKTAYYIMRWINTHGEQGPWSDAVSATIA
jgi:hypothetical protein